MPSKRPNDDTANIDAIGDETMIVNPTVPHDGDGMYTDEEEIIFDADGNIPCDESPGWRPPTTEREMEAYLVWSSQQAKTKVIYGTMPEADVPLSPDERDDILEGFTRERNYSTLPPGPERSNVVDEFMEMTKARVADMQYPHLDGNGQYRRCNVAEDHATTFPGHSVTIIKDYDPTTEPQYEPVLRMICHGTPDAYMNDEQDCHWFEQVRLSK
jgi:hypothetical protein